MKLSPIFFNSVLVGLPLAVLMGGCGGGSNGPTTPTATPLSTATPTPSATVTATPLPVQTVSPIQFALSDGRVVTMRLQTQGRRVFGVVETPLVTTASARHSTATPPSIPLRWDGGNYAVDGAFTPPLSINLTGEIRQNGVAIPIVFRGTLPTQTTSGTFLLTVGIRTVTVKVPAVSGPTATAMPLPISTSPA